MKLKLIFSFFAINLLFFASLNAQNHKEIDSIKIYYLNFNTEIRYAFHEENIIEKSNFKVFKKGQTLFNKIKSIGNYKNKCLSASNNHDYSRINLRLLCIVYYDDNSIDKIGFSNNNSMLFNESVCDRDDDFLIFLSDFTDKSTKKSIKKSIRVLKKQRE